MATKPTTSRVVLCSWISMQIEWPEYGHWDEQEQKDVVRHHRIIILYGHHRHHHQRQQITEIDLVQIQA